MRKIRASLVFAAGLLMLFAGCASLERSSLDDSGNLIVLLNPERELSDEWVHRRLKRGDTSYECATTKLGTTIRATGHRSASILYRLVDPIAPECNRLRWSWFVARPQASSNLRIKGMDDVAASIFIMFGDPGLLLNRPVPTLKYVWANKHHQVGDIIVGPYLEKYVRTIVVRTGRPAGEELITDQVNLREDYMKAFGQAPGNGIYGIAIFTDNDDTNEPIVAHYGKIDLLCSEQ